MAERTPTTPGADPMYPCRICGVKGVLVGQVCYDDARVCKSGGCNEPADPASPGGLCPACAAAPSLPRHQFYGSSQNDI